MPTATSVTVLIDSVHTVGVVDAKLTVRPEDAVALTVNGLLLRRRLDNVPKVMVWLAWVT